MRQELIHLFIYSLTHSLIVLFLQFSKNRIEFSILTVPVVQQRLLYDNKSTSYSTIPTIYTVVLTFLILLLSSSLFSSLSQHYTVITHHDMIVIVNSANNKHKHKHKQQTTNNKQNSNQEIDELIKRRGSTDLI